MAQGMDLMGNMAPFILRGVTLKGIDSVMFAKEKRAAIWQQIRVFYQAFYLRINPLTIQRNHTGSYYHMW